MTTRVHTIDLEYLGTPRAIASYVLVGPGGPVLVETGPGVATAGLERGLAHLGLAARDIGHVLVTHIHFDHAGAAGWLARQGAHVWVHEFGRAHLVDPSRLVASARRIYGDRMDELWGELEPIPDDRVTAVRDRDVLELAGMKITAIETPGHARHHHAYAVETDEGRVAFTGDAAAAAIPECPGFVSIASPPPEFQLGTWLASLQRLEGERFDRLYATHFGAVDDPPAHLALVRRSLREHAAFVQDLLRRGESDAEIRRRYAAWFAAQAEVAGVRGGQLRFYVTDTMSDMNVTGLVRYWGKMGLARAGGDD